MKKALVVDWLDKYGGAERVISVLHKTFQFDEIYALANVMREEDLAKIYQQQPREIHTTFLQKFGKYFRSAFFLMHNQMEKLTVDKDVKLIVSSSHAVAKGIQKTTENQVHISYFQARNFKYIWEDQDLYFGKWSKMLTPLIKRLQKKDIEQAQYPDYMIANSHFVRQWIKEKYNRDSQVIYPPTDLHRFPLCQQKEDYYVAVGRLEPYKRFDIVVEAFNQTGKKLVIIGDGSQKNKLRKSAGKNIVFTGFLNSDEVCSYMSKAKGFVHAGIEDFGITAVEAQSCGTPVIAFNQGGMKETIIEGKTGVTFSETTPENLNQALEQFEKLPFDYQAIHLHAQKFSEERFITEMKQFVEEVMNS